MASSSTKNGLPSASSTSSATSLACGRPGRLQRPGHAPRAARAGRDRARRPSPARASRATPLPQRLGRCLGPVRQHGQDRRGGDCAEVEDHLDAWRRLRRWASSTMTRSARGPAAAVSSRRTAPIDLVPGDRHRPGRRRPRPWVSARPGRRGPGRPPRRARRDRPASSCSIDGGQGGVRTLDEAGRHGHGSPSLGVGDRAGRRGEARTCRCRPVRGSPPGSSVPAPARSRAVDDRQLDVATDDGRFGGDQPLDALVVDALGLGAGRDAELDPQRRPQAPVHGDRGVPIGPRRAGRASAHARPPRRSGRDLDQSLPPPAPAAGDRRGGPDSRSRWAGSSRRRATSGSRSPG